MNENNGSKLYMIEDRYSRWTLWQDGKLLIGMDTKPGYIAQSNVTIIEYDQ